MKRSNKQDIIYIFQFVIIILTICLIIYWFNDLERVFLLIFPIESFLIIIWQEFRNDPELYILNALDFEAPVDRPFLISHKRYFFSRKITFYKHNYSGHQLNELKIHFDVGNRGKSDTTLHEYSVWTLEPEIKQEYLVPTFDTVRKQISGSAAPIDETNLLRRKLITKNSRSTYIFNLMFRTDFTIIRIELYSVRREARNDYVFLFDREKRRFFYTKCTSWYSYKYFKKNINKIKEKLANIE